MIAIKEAAVKALQHFEEVYQSDDYSRVHVEEVDLSEDSKSWWVVIGFDDKPAGSLGLDLLERKYKRFVIDAANGELRAIKVHHMG